MIIKIHQKSTNQTHLSRFEDNSDGVVTREDAEGILEAVTATTETIERIEGVNHRELVDDERTEDLIRGAFE